MHDGWTRELHRMRSLPRQMQIAIVAGTAVLVAGAIGVGASWRLLTRIQEEAVTAAPMAAPGTLVLTPTQWAGLKLAPVQSLAFHDEQVVDGNIAINRDTMTQAFSLYSGRVTRLIAEPGDRVEKGAPLMAVEASALVQGQRDLASAVAARNTAQARLDLAQIKEKREHALYDARAGLLNDWQQSQVDLATAAGDLRAAEATLSAVRSRLRSLGKSDQEISAVEASPTMQRMDPEAIIAAPVAGTVTERQIELGQSVRSGAANPVYAIADMSTVWLMANVNEADAALVHVGEPIDVHVPAYPGRVFKAKIVWVASAVDPSAHRLPVRAEVENADGALKPMMTASFSIITGTTADAPAVPISALVHEGGTTRVWVQQGQNAVTLRSVKIGRIGDGMVEVTDGLIPGEAVVTSGTLLTDRPAQSD